MAEFVELTYLSVFKTALRITCNVEDAEDTCQNAFVRFFQSLKDFQGKSSLRTWLYRIVVNCAIDMTRVSKTRSVEPEGLIENYNPIRHIMNKELTHKIQKAMEKLEPRQREIFALKHFDGLKFKQIAEILGISISTAKTHFYRAIISLRKSLCDCVEE